MSFANLVTTLSLNRQPFTSGLQGAGGALKGFTGRISGLVGKLGPMAAGLAGVAGAAGLGMMVNRSFQSIDSLAKMSDALGMTTEALAGMRRAGERSGVAAESVEKGLARMQKTLSSAAAAGGSKNLDMLGLSLENLRGLSAEEQFFQIADAINGMEDQTDKTRLAMEMFGRDGTNMLKIVGKGADAARAELAKAAELGLAPSREEAERIEEANDAWADMKDSFVGVANSIAVSLAPMVTSISEKVMGFGKLARRSFDSLRPPITQFGNLAMAYFDRVAENWSILMDMIGLSGGDTFQSVADWITDAMIVGEWALQNFDKIAAWVWENTKLGAVGLFEDISHFFTSTIPAVFQWFSKSWRSTFFTAFDLATTVFANIGQNVRNVFTAIWNFVKTRKWDVAFVPLTDGFHNAMDKLEIPRRQLTDTEKRLKANVDALGSELETSLGDLMVQRRAEMDDLMRPRAPREPAEPQVEFDDEDFRSEEAQAARTQETGAAALERGSAEAFSAIQAAMRGGSIEDKQLVEQKAHNKHLGEQNKILKRIESAIDADEPADVVDF